MDLVKRLLRDESGQDLAEYGIALAVIAGGVGLIALFIGGLTLNLWSQGSSAIASAS